MKLSELLSAAGIICPEDIMEMDTEVTAVVTNSEKVVRGSVFICIEGERYDGHDYIRCAIDAGASVIIARHVCDDCVGGAAIILVDNTRRAAALLYNAFFGDPCGRLKVIGITGTNGKTSTSVMLRSLFEGCGIRCGLIGTLGAYLDGDRAIEYPKSSKIANMTTPDAEGLYFALSKMVEEGIEYVVMEVSSHALVQCRTDAIFFDCAIFTNLTQDHLDFHGDMESYFLAKEKLFKNCRLAVVNTDDIYGKKIFDISPKESFACSRVGEGDFFTLFESFTADGISFTVRRGDIDTDIKLSLLGDFMVSNALLAFATACIYISDREKLTEILSRFEGVRGRMERVPLNENCKFSVFIDYAHTPDAIEKLLLTVRGFRQEGGRIIILFGCGGERDRDKRKKMAQVASRLSDLVVVTSDNSRGEEPRQIFADIMKGIDKEKPYILIEDRAEAIKYALTYARTRDIVLLAGKGHEKYEIDCKGRHFFDEREVVRAFVGA